MDDDGVAAHPIPYLANESLEVVVTDKCFGCVKLWTLEISLDESNNS